MESSLLWTSLSQPKLTTGVLHDNNLLLISPGSPSSSFSGYASHLNPTNWFMLCFPFRNICISVAEQASPLTGNLTSSLPMPPNQEELMALPVLRLLFGSSPIVTVTLHCSLDVYVFVFV